MRNLKSSITRLLPWRALALLVLSALLTVSAYAQADKWLQLGKGQTSKVSSSAYIPADESKGTVCALRFQADGGEIEIEELTVHFSNSQSLHIPIPSLMKVGGIPSHAVSLPGSRRTVKGVDIVFRLVEPDNPPALVSLSGNALPQQTYCPR